MSDAREQFAACEALLTKGDVEACAAAAETLTKQYPKHARAWCLRAALAPHAAARSQPPPSILSADSCSAPPGADLASAGVSAASWP